MSPGESGSVHKLHQSPRALRAKRRVRSKETAPPRSENTFRRGFRARFAQISGLTSDLKVEGAASEVWGCRGFTKLINSELSFSLQISS